MIEVLCDNIANRPWRLYLLPVLLATKQAVVDDQRRLVRLVILHLVSLVCQLHRHQLPSDLEIMRQCKLFTATSPDAMNRRVKFHLAGV